MNDQIFVRRDTLALGIPVVAELVAVGRIDGEPVWEVTVSRTLD